MGEKYDLPELRQMFAGRSNYTGVTHVGKTHLGGHQNLTSGQDYDQMGVVGKMMLPSSSAAAAAAQGQVQRRVVEFRSDSSSVSGFEEGGGNGRWPRQETLTLLEVRSLLDHKFKEANHKGPLWDEVSRIMAEEHGYQRSGKKCREKLENLYKYYKKTKEGKAGRQDGKHYRFFRQLDALYGENSNPTIETNLIGNNPCLQSTNPSTFQLKQDTFQGHEKLSESLSLSNSSESNTSSSSDDEDLNTIAITGNDTINKQKDASNLKRGRKSWKAKIREFVDLQMKKFMDIQEAWLERMLKTIEHHEQERLAREEAWRKQESERFNHEHRIWASERAWIEARSTALIEALNKFNRHEIKTSLSPEELTAAIDIHEDGQNEMENGREAFGSSMNNRRCSELEILYLIQLRSAMEMEFKEGGYSNSALWQEIAGKMGCLGYDIDANRCKEKWESINGYLKKNKDSNKKRKENSKTCPYFQHLDSLYIEGGGICSHGTNEQVLETAAEGPNNGPSPSNSNTGAVRNDSCLRFLMADGENLWENYGVKLNKDGSQ
ncbi:hypothetical protein MRB53_017984 [Persea americana]|uniref:Uncharacterized protein n=1 Tax=Persea americana TaxID=3435 RepID=A0ACC2M6M6_PERAE|nr:hypothetical protein MRB53_017984 [Persea americana]|eukprot:TRINITY_DN69942_c0_g1_i1.p1 TRINITY_DN69942_c0_g1~~TRINITY_DN69942_c0_g1_i1.p1  ORF type:complete len:549 (-),score=130.36 TRINITY_DN69942_c0_g1_i1:397-2043(-)